MTSKTHYVRYLLQIRSFVVAIWRVSPKFISRFLLRFLRNGTSFISFGIRYLCVKRLARSCGQKVIIFPGVFLKNIQNLDIGTNVSIHEMSYIDAFGKIKIDDNVAISHGVSIISFDHDINLGHNNYKDAPAVTGQITIKDNVWIGAGARILKDVIIEKDCVIAAGSLVNKSCDEKSLIGGVPAKLIKKIN
jgi:acetyltransferase-like isoleucine patch superfamily enzyme